MSKTIIVMDAPDNAVGIEQISDENPYFLGAFGEVISILKQAFPKGDFSEPTEINISTDKGNIKIEIAKHTPVQSFMICLENSDTTEIIQKLCEKANWRALDTDTGLFIDKKAKGNKIMNSKAQKSWWRLWEK
jgi:hypothetical protein